MSLVSFCMVALVLVQLVSCQQADVTQEPAEGGRHEPWAFLRAWVQNTNPQVELNEKQAAWWYSLGEYRPRNRDEDRYYPLPLYEEEVPYDRPPYLYNETDCERIPGPLRTRYEFREMSAAMRSSYTSAVNALANYCPDGCSPCNTAPTCTSAYDLFVLMHQSFTSPGAHGGASFLPFHREYLWRFENAMILNGGYPAHLGVPYWDSILDSGLPDPAASVLWTSWFMGNENGLLGAPFAGMTVPSSCGGTINRAAPGGPGSYLFQESDVTDLMSQSCFAHLTQNSAWTCPWGAGVACNFESRHGYPHMWVGGDMGNFCSPSDPLFWLHHGFMDCLWEKFRNGPQRSHLEKEYPQTSFGGPQAAWDAPMAPFSGLINAHGLSTHYTTYYYQCSKRPSGRRCRRHRHCNPIGRTLNPNPALWCDNRVCRSKIREGGSCVRNGVNLPNTACWCNNPGLGNQPVCRADGTCGCGFLIGPAPADPADITS